MIVISFIIGVVFGMGALAILSYARDYLDDK